MDLYSLKIYTASVLLIISMANAAAVDGISESSSTFSKNLFAAIKSDKENIIISPASIQTCLSLAFFGANGQTEKEMASGLSLGTANKEIVAQRFGNLMKSTSDSGLVKIANRIYANNQLHVQDKFNTIAKDAFQSVAEPINFKDGAATVETINKWVENATNNTIKNLVSSVEPDTSMILVNAIYLKAQWRNKFDMHSTRKADFWIDPNAAVQVDTMYNSDHYNYAELTDLDAVAIELPYDASDLSMVIVLPNTRDGLRTLEDKLQSFNLLTLTQQMKDQDVEVNIPKFKIESEFKLKNDLIKMGMPTMFSDSADFSDIFEEKIPVKASDVVHKAYINVDEDGTEAGAATYMKIVPMSLNLNQKSFRADHPFLYYIKNQNYVFFMGHVVKF